MTTEPQHLPVLGQPRAERADAARNRRRVLEAASALMAERGPEAVAMDDVADLAGVGKGTLYRRFGDRQGLLLAMLDDAERDLQNRLLTDPPPLGPGGPPEPRLRAFLHALIELLEARGEIIRASETSVPGQRLRGGAYRAWHQHLCVLLAERQAESETATYAHLLLAPLAAESWTSLRAAGVPRDRLVRSLEQLWPTEGPPLRDLRIRAARSEELPALQELERAAGHPFREIGMHEVADDEPPALDELARLLSAGWAWVAAGEGDRPVAYAVAEPVDGALHVEQVSVHPDSARQRLGSALLEHLAHLARARGLSAMTLTTFADVPWNGPYYRRCGFRVLADAELTAGLRAIRAREAAHGLDRWPRIVMRRDL